MNLFDVYPLFDITPVKAKGSEIWDKNGVKYLDLYGGHAVISIGHSHPYYIQKLTDQLQEIGFYSNAVKITSQEQLAEKLGQLSGYENYQLFLCNSGAEANENALKLASFHNGKKKIIAFQKSFHGRTSLAVAATDDKSINAAINENENIVFLPLNDINAFEQAISNDTCAVIIEGIQGVGGVNVPDIAFLKLLKKRCVENNALLILDEVQSGYGRTGKFFAHQYADIQPDIISVAKGMGNGFPIAGVLIHPDIKPRHGMLGTTFGGNHLACAAGLAVLDILQIECLMDKAAVLGKYLKAALQNTPGIIEVKGMGLMLGIVLNQPCAPIRNELLHTYKIFTGSSSDKNTLRILPALNVPKAALMEFVEALKTLLSKTNPS